MGARERAEGDGPAGELAHLADGLLRLARLVERALGVRLQELAGLGQLEALARADEQRDAQLGLQPAHLLGQARLRHMQGFRGRGERSVARCGKEIRELLQGQGFTYRRRSQSSLKQCRTSADTRSMLIIALIAALGVGVAFAAEDRPGFDERSPLS